MGLVNIDLDKAAKVLADEVGEIIDKSEARLQETVKAAVSEAVASALAEFRNEMVEWRVFLSTHSIRFVKNPDVGPTQ